MELNNEELGNTPAADAAERYPATTSACQDGMEKVSEKPPTQLKKFTYLLALTHKSLFHKITRTASAAPHALRTDGALCGEICATNGGDVGRSRWEVRVEGRTDTRSAPHSLVAWDISEVVITFIQILGVYKWQQTWGE